MTTTQQKNAKMVSTSSKDLEDLISKAIKKIGGSKENDLCRYLPGDGGYMHHFTLRKMKHQVPQELSQMIKKFITDADKPKTVPPKPRAARGSRKRKDHIILSKKDVEELIIHARTANADEVIRKLIPKRDLKTIKKELVASIRREEIDLELWTSFTEALKK